MKILVPVDFSPISEKALAYAREFVGLEKAEIIIYHSYMPFITGFYNPDQSKKENKEEEKKLHTMLNGLAEALSANHKNLAVTTFLDQGVETKGILKYSRQKKADLIIMGTTGASGLKEKLIGSVTAEIISQSPCPVIAVPEKYKVHRIEKMVFVTDYKISDAGGLQFLVNIAQRFDATISIWHFMDGNHSTDYEDELTENYKKFVQQVISYPKVDYHFSKTEDLEESLDRLARKKSTDLLAMFTHKRKSFIERLLHKSLVKQVSFHTLVPLLAFPMSSR